MSSLARAIEIAAQVHRDQADKNGALYILHPLRVMMRFAGDEPAMMAAVLHDVVEDSEWTPEHLRNEGFAEEVVDAVVALTKTESEEPGKDATDEIKRAAYFAFIRRAAEHPIARRVKLADIEDNLDVCRLDVLDEETIERMRKYHEARKMLLPTGD